MIDADLVNPSNVVIEVFEPERMIRDKLTRSPIMGSRGSRLLYLQAQVIWGKMPAGASRPGGQTDDYDGVLTFRHRDAATLKDEDRVIAIQGFTNLAAFLGDRHPFGDFGEGAGPLYLRFAFSSRHPTRRP